jgi:hypothetical protein
MEVLDLGKEEEKEILVDDMQPGDVFRNRQGTYFMRIGGLRSHNVVVIGHKANISSPTGRQRPIGSLHTYSESYVVLKDVKLAINTELYKG